MKFSDIHWIFFDVGGVLLDDTVAEKRRMQLLLEICKTYKPTLQMSDMLRARISASAKIGSLEANIIELVIQNSGQCKQAQEEASSRWKEVDYEGNSAFRSEALDVAAALSKKYKLGIMANQPVRTTKRLEESGLLHYFYHSDMSEKYTFHKPDPRLYREVFRETGAIPTQSVMIDDNIERGLLPAKELGMKTIWYRREMENRESNPPVNAIISSLPELLSIL